MEKPRGFADQVEKWLSHIPGVRTYKNREQRRETDKQFREQLASRLQEMKSQLNQIALNFSQKQELGLLPEIDRLSSRLQQIADMIRYASYGYGGIFDLQKIREEELDRLYNFDLSLMEDLEGIQGKLDGMGQSPSPETWKKGSAEAGTLLRALDKKFRQRKEFMSRAADE